MSNQILNKPVLPRISDFYDGKSVLLTGATGFLGVILLEVLLRACPGIERIYLLVREKRGVQPESRKESILNKPVFNELKETDPEVFKKIFVITGDVSQPDLGMDEIGLFKVTQNVSIVFHCAACISFLRPLKYILIHNSGATQNVIEVCRKLKSLDAFVYTSTAFSNCNRLTEIEEKVYRLPFLANKFLDELHNGKGDSIQKLVDECQPKWPNNYTFSKNLSENIIQDNAADLPTAIVRPSLISPTWVEPMKGYIEDSSGISALSVGVGKGFIKVIHGDPASKFDFIPVDIVAHAHILAAMKAASCRSSSPWIFNCTSFSQPSLREYCDCMLSLVKEHPLPNTFRLPNTLKIEKDAISYWWTAHFEHYIPAFVFDVYLKMAGSKKRLFDKYKFVDAAINAIHYFITNSWTYETNNFQRLVMGMQPEDKKTLGTSCKGGDLYMESISKDLLDSAPFYQWKNDKKSIQDRMRTARQRMWLTVIVQCSVFAIICYLMKLSFSYFFDST